MQKITGLFKNRKIWFVISLIVILLGSIVARTKIESIQTKENIQTGFSEYIIRDDKNVFKILFPVYENNPNSNSSIYSYYKLMKEDLIDGKFNVLINNFETDNYSIESHQTMKVFDYLALDEPKFAMYAIYISYPKAMIDSVTKEDLISYAKNQAILSDTELSKHEIRNYRGSIAIEYEYPIQLDKNVMTSKHLAFLNNGAIVNLSIIRTQHLTERDVYFDQFIDSFESADLATGSLLLGN